MPPEPLPFDRKDFLKERKPSSSDPAGVVPAQWREPSTTPSSHPNNHGFFSYRWGGAGGSSDYRRPLSGHGKQVGGSCHVTTVVESAPLEDKFCRNDNIRDNNHINSLAVPSSIQKDSWETTVSPRGSSHPPLDFVNPWDQHQSKDQHDKNNGAVGSTTGGQRLENDNSLGSSIDWKPLKWIRSGSLSSRGSGFSHSSSSKSIAVDSHDIKIDSPAGNSTPLQSPSEDAIPCLTPRTPADEVSSRKKPRLGWGEGLAKYEKKKVGPDENVDKDVHTKNGMIDGAISSEHLLPSPANVPDKSPSLTGCSECASPATPYSFACSSSPGVEEKAAAAAVDNDSCNPRVPSCHPSNTHPEGSIFNLETLELPEGFNLTSSLDELLQGVVTSAPTSGFLRCTAMDKLQVWKADISRTIEITESEIDSLENELKKLVSDLGGSCDLATASCSLPTECNKKNKEKSEGLTLRVKSSGDTPFEKANGFVEELDRESPGTATSKLVEHDSISIFDVRSERMEPKCSQENVSNDTITACGDNSRLPASSKVHFSKEDKLYDVIMSSNKVAANEASNEFSNLLPSRQWSSNIPRVTNESLIKKNIAARKRFLNFKERVLTLKFRAFQYLWKDDIRLLSLRRSGSKSLKKFEFGYAGHQKCRSSLKHRLSSAGSLNRDQTTEVVYYLNSLLSDSQVRIYRNALKMPSFILDKRVRMGSRFISDNRLVENPIEVEKERSLTNPWTVEEKEFFLDKYSLFGKDFKKIASFLEHKTIADCVEFYYKNHKSDSFQKAKKNSVFARGKSSTANTYLLTSGRRFNQKTHTTSLEMLGAASEIVANVQKCTPNYNDQNGDDSISESSRETTAADVLAGISESISFFNQGKRRFHTSKTAINDVDEDTCSDDSRGVETDLSVWTDEEKSSFVNAVRIYGKDFSSISWCLRTRSSDQCRVFYSKSRKSLGLDLIGLEGNPGSGRAHDDDDDDDDHDHDPEDACMVRNGSVISSPDPHSSDFQEEHDAESDQKLVNGSLVETQQNTNSQQSPKILDLCTDDEGVMKLNEPKNGFLLTGLFPQDVTNRKTLGHDDVAMSSRLSFRKSGRSSSTDGYHLHLPTHSLLDCAGSAPILDEPTRSNLNLDLDPDPNPNPDLTDPSCWPRDDGFMQKCPGLISESQEHIHSSPNVEKPSRSGELKLFGQILTKCSRPQERERKTNGGGSYNLNVSDRRSASLDLDRHKYPSFHVDPNVGLRSYGFWDGNRIQTGFSSLPDSAILQAKYPAAFSSAPLHSFLRNGNEPGQLNHGSGKKSGHGSGYGLGGKEEQGINGGVVSDPVAAIRMHYATYKNGR